jgi:hypothetical protein
MKSRKFGRTILASAGLVGALGGSLVAASPASAVVPIGSPTVTITLADRSINVHVVDRSNNETGFEVFRLRTAGVQSPSSFPGWEYLTERDSTPANVPGQGASYDIPITTFSPGPQCFLVAAYNDSTSTLTGVECIVF